MDVVFVLHSHLPYVLNHGRWPHGSDWLCEAAVHSYLPLLEQLLRLEDENTPTPMTLGITPILANQLGHPAFRRELEDYFEHRIAAAEKAIRTFQASGETELAPVAEYWQRRYHRLADCFGRLDGDLITAFRRLEDRGRLELLGSAATHGMLPLLGRDESIRLQLLLGRQEHQRTFGRAPRGCWLPECAYRPAGRWAPLPKAPSHLRRVGLEDHLAHAGFQFFLTDSHLAHAGRAHEVYATQKLERELLPVPSADPPQHTPYSSYRLFSRPSLGVLIRDPVATRQVWSRYEGYPGDAAYLEFHKIRWPEGLRLWRVSAPKSDLADKQPYRPDAARRRASLHARHFVSLLGETARDQGTSDGAIVAPFDTELFGHWWHEGPEFLSQTWQVMSRHAGVTAATASRYLTQHPPELALSLEEGSWGANGDFSMWMNPKTEWMWLRMWDLEAAFWNATPDAISNAAAHPALEQAARELLLAQASDWPFIVSTGAAADYAEQRFTGHCDRVAALLRGLGSGELESATRMADEFRRQDDVFPEV
ncbi:MAG TPA: 1,4-alpha-glucan branching protein domain-containing protein, partial [Gemmatimonadales bacterium]|nr:1,4-alpha-glucan branching protein domain-containing protein [Gemmatimonadales bacterium]